MTNLSTIAGATIWSAVALTLMMVAFEPVALEKAPAQSAIYAAAPEAGALA